MTESFLKAMIATKQNEPLADVKIKYGFELVKNEFFKFLFYFIFPSYR